MVLHNCLGVAVLGKISGGLVETILVFILFAFLGRGVDVVVAADAALEVSVVHKGALSQGGQVDGVEVGVAARLLQVLEHLGLVAQQGHVLLEQVVQLGRVDGGEGGVGPLLLAGLAVDDDLDVLDEFLAAGGVLFGADVVFLL
ncbi:hypothetical protein PG996_015237 [Apiospora saccharicola]|uniref:Secreted protein n=1 Tax=Apiospora saccharicola TaxID=335842 RepID=A0ABR1TKK1_9PEZI